MENLMNKFILFCAGFSETVIKYGGRSLPIAPSSHGSCSSEEHLNHALGGCDISRNSLKCYWQLLYLAPHDMSKQCGSPMELQAYMVFFEDYLVMTPPTRDLLGMGEEKLKLSTTVTLHPSLENLILGLQEPKNKPWCPGVSSTHARLILLVTWSEGSGNYGGIRGIGSQRPLWRLRCMRTAASMPRNQFVIGSDVLRSEIQGSLGIEEVGPLAKPRSVTSILMNQIYTIMNTTGHCPPPAWINLLVSIKILWFKYLKTILHDCHGYLFT